MQVIQIRGLLKIVGIWGAVFGVNLGSFMGVPVFAQSYETMERDIIKRTNFFRSQQGRAVLQPDAILMKTARSFACYMARTGNYGHRGDGRTPTQRAAAQGFPAKGCVSENIAWNTYPRGRQGDVLTNGWINSPGHRANMLARGAKITGVGVCHAGNRFYGVQLIGRRRWASLAIINKSPRILRYAYKSGQKMHRGQVNGVRNGWRSTTLQLCGYARVTVTNGRKTRTGYTGDRGEKIIFE